MVLSLRSLHFGSPSVDVPKKVDLVYIKDIACLGLPFSILVKELGVHFEPEKRGCSSWEKVRLRDIILGPWRTYSEAFMSSL